MKDTIIATATAQGKSAIAVIRMSGNKSLDIINGIFKGPRLENRRIAYGKIINDNVVIDEVMAVYMKGPGTYTGQDSVEIYCHGSSIVLKGIMEAAINNGARMAKPGEFTQRGFLNGRMDLSQAEAVADVINANTKSAADTALNQLSGRLKTSVNDMIDMLIKEIANIEVCVDYPQEDIEDETAVQAKKTILKIIDRMDQALETANRGKIYRNGIRCAIIGQPNTGKSSLLNSILGESRAIVTPTAGTTRDTLEAHIDIDGIEVILTDTAGIREGGDDVEKLGVKRAKDALDNAQLILFVLDMSKAIDKKDIDLYNDIKDKAHIMVLSKSDLESKFAYNDIRRTFGDISIVETSTVNNDGIIDLENMIIGEILGDDYLLPQETELSNLRHIDAVKRAKQSLYQAVITLDEGMSIDLAVIDLRDAVNALGEITGADVDEDIINSIFKDFCVGK